MLFQPKDREGSVSVESILLKNNSNAFSFLCHCRSVDIPDTHINANFVTSV